MQGRVGHASDIDRLKDGAAVARLDAGAREFFGVQALRAVAALIVVAGHATDYLVLRNGWMPVEYRWLHGQAGVDIFFVISGFVMMISAPRLQVRPHPARVFLWRRVIRIVPLYWLLTALALAVLVIKPSLSIHAMPGAWNVIASFLFIPSRAADGEVRPLLTLGWTLSFEMLFYLVFAVALAVRRGVVRVLLPVMLAVAAVGIVRTRAWPAWTLIIDPIVLEFLAGVGIARLATIERLPRAMVAMGAIVAGFGGLVLLSPGYSPLSRPLTWGVCAVLIVLGVVALERRFGRRLPWSLLLLGDASYSIYLLQTVVLAVLHGILAWVSPGLVHREPVLAGLVLIVAGLLATAAVGVGIYRLVERPMTQRLRRWSGSAVPAAVTP